MSDLSCPSCHKLIQDVEEEFENEASAEADVEGDCPHCAAYLIFQRRVEYDVKKAN